jgi:hypothetical protein
MKLMLSLVCFFAATSAIAAAPCANIAGQYRPPFEGEDADVVTTITIDQNDCDSIEIGATVLGKKFFESEDRVYRPILLWLKGLPAPSELECLNAYYDVCGSYVATKAAIVKTMPQGKSQISADPIHGACFSLVSAFSKDAAGNLVETLQGAKCEDGFTGNVAPVIWPKAN